MKPFPIPVVPMLGPGSQPPEEDYHVLTPGTTMDVFRAPIARPPASAEILEQAQEQLRGLVQQMEALSFGASPAPRLDLLGIPPAVIDEINELLGQGEVSILVRGSQTLRVQETAFPALWRVQCLREDGSLATDRVEAGPMPEAVLDALAAAPTHAEKKPEPPGLMNAPATPPPTGPERRPTSSTSPCCRSRRKTVSTSPTASTSAPSPCSPAATATAASPPPACRTPGGCSISTAWISSS